MHKVGCAEKTTAAAITTATTTITQHWFHLMGNTLVHLVKSSNCTWTHYVLIQHTMDYTDFDWIWRSSRKIDDTTKKWALGKLNLLFWLNVSSNKTRTSLEMLINVNNAGNCFCASETSTTRSTCFICFAFPVSQNTQNNKTVHLDNTAQSVYTSFLT